VSVIYIGCWGSVVGACGEKRRWGEAVILTSRIASENARSLADPTIQIYYYYYEEHNLYVYSNTDCVCTVKIITYNTLLCLSYTAVIPSPRYLTCKQFWASFSIRFRSAELARLLNCTWGHHARAATVRPPRHTTPRTTVSRSFLSLRHHQIVSVWL
jgi:hypothetical protein